jgi:hypothetical protein
MRVDFKNSRITPMGAEESGPKKETPIQSSRREDGKLMVQGAGIQGWSMVMTEKTGKMLLTATGDDVGLMLFGECIAQ